MIYGGGEADLESAEAADRARTVNCRQPRPGLLLCEQVLDLDELLAGREQRGQWASGRERARRSSSSSPSHLPLLEGEVEAEKEEVMRMRSMSRMRQEKEDQNEDVRRRRRQEEEE